MYKRQELGYAFSKGKVIAITGTNGKTTTTALTGQIMRDYYESVFVVGNIGNPYTPVSYTHLDVYKRQTIYSISKKDAYHI